MAYVFKGFFANANEDALKAALEKWPFCQGRNLGSPFVGIAVRCPSEFADANSHADCHKLEANVLRVENELPEFSGAFPDVAFVYVFAECFGGVCDYWGFVAKNGKIDVEVVADDNGDENLQTLLSALGVTVKNGYFEPFLRDYWD